MIHAVGIAETGFVEKLEGVSPFDFAQVPVMDGVQHPGDNAGEVRRAGTLRYERWEA